MLHRTYISPRPYLFIKFLEWGANNFLIRVACNKWLINQVPTLNGAQLYPARFYSYVRHKKSSIVAGFLGPRRLSHLQIHVDLGKLVWLLYGDCFRLSLLWYCERPTPSIFYEFSSFSQIWKWPWLWWLRRWDNGGRKINRKASPHEDLWGW